MSTLLTNDNLRNTSDRISTPTLVVAIIALHIALTSWQLWFNQINDDGVLYVRAARLFADGKFAEGRAIYNWFGFPLLIGAVSRMTSLDALVTAPMINLLASTGTMLLLLRMSWIELPSKILLCIVAILIFGNYHWNGLRGALVRDQLFYFFVLLSFFCLLRDRPRPHLVNKVGFACSCLCASAFRMEAAALLVMVPALLGATETSPRKYRRIWLAVWLTAAAAIIFAIAYQAGAKDISKAFSDPATRIGILRDQVLAPFVSRRALLAYNWIIVGLVVSGILSSLNPLSIAVTGWGATRSAAFRQRYFLRLLGCYCAVTFLVLAAQTYFSLVFEPRYGLAVGLLLTIPAALAIATLLETSALRRPLTKFAIVSAVGWLGYGLLGPLNIIDNNRFQLEAAQWLRVNVQADAKTLSNNNQISFYGNLPARDADDDQFLLKSISRTGDISTLRTWSNYDVVVIRLRQNQLDQVPRLDAAIGKPPSKEFVNSRGDKILIYQPRKSS